MSNQPNDGGAAYPQTMLRDHNDGIIPPENYGCGGMSLRDYFAGQAAVGFLSGGWQPRNGLSITETVISKLAYDLADAMLAARERTADVKA